MTLRHLAHWAILFLVTSICSIGTAVAQNVSPDATSSNATSDGGAESTQKPVEPSDAVQSQGGEVRVNRFDDWTYRCLLPAAPASDAGSEPAQLAEPACEIFQSVFVEQAGGAVEVLNVALSRANDAQARYDWALVVLAPLDVHLPSDFGLSTDGREPEIVRYRNCNQLGCFVVIPADTALINRLKRANNGAGHFRLVNGQTVKIVFSLIGFTKAFNAMASGDVPDPAEALPATSAAVPASEAP